MTEKESHGDRLLMEMESFLENKSSWRWSLTRRETTLPDGNLDSSSLGRN